MTSEQAATLIENTTSPLAFFDLKGTEPEKAYRIFAKLVHPDYAAKSLGQERAEKAFAKLSNMFASLNGKTISNPEILGEWIVESPFAKGYVCDLYRVIHKD